MTDLVNNPPHYTSHQSGIECIEITRHLGFNRGNALKYLWRCGKKDDDEQELKKAIWYLKDELSNNNDVSYGTNIFIINDKLDELVLYQTDQERQLFNLIIFGTQNDLQQAIHTIEGMIDE